MLQSVKVVRHEAVQDCAVCFVLRVKKEVLEIACCPACPAAVLVEKLAKALGDTLGPEDIERLVAEINP